MSYAFCLSTFHLQKKVGARVACWDVAVLLLLALLEYLNQVDLREKADLQEKEAQESLDSGKNSAMTTKNLLETLSKPDQIPLFYAGGIEILTEMMKDCKPAVCVIS